MAGSLQVSQEPQILKAGHYQCSDNKRQSKAKDNAPLRENKTGPRIDPWGTPQVRQTQTETLSAMEKRTGNLIQRARKPL